MLSVTQMKLLISLARIDGRIADRERNYIVNIGRANGIYPDEITPLFDQDHQLVVPRDMSVDQKFDYLFSLVQLMKIDERMYKEEILFCSNIATRLGFDQQVMFDMMLHVKPSGMQPEEVNALKSMAKKYLKQ